MRVGDLLASGTISGTEPGSEGSLLEQTKNGKISISLNEGETRSFLEDGDAVTIRGWAGQAEKGLVGFGDCFGSILPAFDA
jgi:fumarylacetoacetase